MFRYVAEDKLVQALVFLAWWLDIRIDSALSGEVLDQVE